MQQQDIIMFGFRVFIFLVWTVSCVQLFHKARIPAWHALVPFYNFYQYTKLAGKSGWYMAGLFVPFVNLYCMAKISYGISKAFGKEMRFAAGVFFLPYIFLPILAFGKSDYIGPGGLPPIKVTPPPFNKALLDSKKAA